MMWSWACGLAEMATTHSLILRQLRMPHKPSHFRRWLSMETTSRLGAPRTRPGPFPTLLNSSAATQMVSLTLITSS